MSRAKSQRPVDEIRAKRIVLVDADDRRRVVLEMVMTDRGGEDETREVISSPRVSVIGENGRPVLILEVVSEGGARIQVGDGNRGPLTEIEAGVVLLGFAGNTRAAIVAREDRGVLDLCDQDGAPLVRIPSDSE